MNLRLIWAIANCVAAGAMGVFTAHWVGDGDYLWSILGVIAAVLGIHEGYTEINKAMTEEANIQDFANKVDK